MSTKLIEILKNLQMNKTNFDPYSLTRPTATSFYENEKFMAKLDF